VALPYRAFPLHVRGTAFQANHVFLLQLEFGRIFDGDDTLCVAYISAHHIQQRRLSGACTAGNKNVEFGPHGGLQGLKNRSGDGAIGQYLLGPDGDFAKTANRENRAIHRERRDDDVDAGSVGQARVAHGRGFVYASADLGYDLIDNMAKVSVVLKNDVGFLQSAGALDIYLSVRVHQDVVDGGILEQRLQRPQAKDFLQHLPRQAVSLGGTERRLQVHDEVLNYLLYLRPRPDILERSEFLQIDLAQQLAMQGGFQFLVRLGGNSNAAWRAPGASANAHIRAKGLCVSHLTP